MVSNCVLGHRKKKIEWNTDLHGVLILAGEGVDSALLDALLALGEALVPGSEFGLAGLFDGMLISRGNGEGGKRR